MKAIFIAAGAIIALYLLVGYVEANAACNPYTYERCSGAELRAVSQVQFQQRNNLDRQIDVAEKYERVVTGKPTEKWNKEYDYSHHTNTYTVVNRNGVWVQETRSIHKEAY
ncbi:MAG: hypothetical protein DRJ03_02460 [Chloroflexi bacterium]|nr:MAG: hypothetical protein DRJ03_02460 [Chloroflexota bacterium]